MRFIVLISLLCAGCGDIAQREKWGGAWNVEVEVACPNGTWAKHLVQHQTWKYTRTVGPDFWQTELTTISAEPCPVEQP